MISFKEYLAEESHRKSIGLQKAKELLETHCKDALKNFKNPLWRGFSGSGTSYLIQGENTERRSANTSNHYTVIMDHFLPPLGYPKRSRSVICANNSNDGGAAGFGRVYALFPYDGVAIGVCEQEDLWYTKMAIGDEEEMSVEKWNSLFNAIGGSEDSYEQLVQDIKNVVTSSSISSTAAKIKKIFPSPDTVEDVLKKAYSPENMKIHLATPATIQKYEDEPRELWIGGKCVAIEYEFWHKIVRSSWDEVLK